MRSDCRSLPWQSALPETSGNRPRAPSRYCRNRGRARETAHRPLRTPRPRPKPGTHPEGFARLSSVDKRLHRFFETTERADPQSSSKSLRLRICLAGLLSGPHSQASAAFDLLLSKTFVTTALFGKRKSKASFGRGWFTTIVVATIRAFETTVWVDC